MRALVTGATGFLGQHLTQRLVAMGHSVRALVRAPPGVAGQTAIEVVRGDLTRPETLPEAMEGVDVVFHLAALRDRWGIPSETYLTVNVDGTRALLAEAVRAGVQRFIYCSSAGVARYPGRVDADEELPYSTPSSQVAYHSTKARAEQAVRAAGQEGQISAVVVRPVITYGPGDQSGMVTQLLSRIDGGRFLQIGNGRNHLDLAYVSDVISGLVGAFAHGAPGEVYILSGAHPITQRELLVEAYRALGKAGPGPVAVPAILARPMAAAAGMLWGMAGQRPPVTRDAVLTLTVDRGFSHARAARELGYRPQWSLGEGLRETVAWLRQIGLVGQLAQDARV